MSNSTTATYSVSLKSLIQEFQLEILHFPESKNVMITLPDVIRPGLALSGHFDFFKPERIELLGHSEHAYLNSLSNEERRSCLDGLCSHHPVAIVLTTSLEADEILMEMAKKYDVPLLRTVHRTAEFMASLISALNVKLAPRITRHGVLVELYGEGVLILGDSGIGKSETAIELVKRGHRLIADDAVEIKKVSSKTLVGSAPELIRHYVELRGIGIVDVRRLFGMGAVKDTEKIDLVVKLEPWQDGKMYDRFGLDSEYTEIMGIQIPSVLIPVKPGRNLAIILEIAAMNNRQKRMGYNTALEFNKKLMGQSDGLDR